MDKGRKASPEKGSSISQPRSLEIAASGINTGVEFARFMSYLMTDLIEGRVSPGIGNACCNAGGKLLKIVELQHRYGAPGPGHTAKILDLTMANNSDLTAISEPGKTH